MAGLDRAEVLEEEPLWGPTWSPGSGQLYPQHSLCLCPVDTNIGAAKPPCEWSSMLGFQGQQG